MVDDDPLHGHPLERGEVLRHLAELRLNDVRAPRLGDRPDAFAAAGDGHADDTIRSSSPQLSDARQPPCEGRPTRRQDDLFDELATATNSVVELGILRGTEIHEPDLVPRAEATAVLREATDTMDQLLKPKEWPGPDWSQAPEWAMWWAMDKTSLAHWYRIAPDQLDWMWSYRIGEFDEAPCFGYTGHWRDSLRKRPDTAK